LAKSLQPFVSKKIVDYLGVREDELVSFVIDHLRVKKSAAELTKETEMVRHSLLILNIEGVMNANSFNFIIDFDE
jgi:hypothetical protein